MSTPSYLVLSPCPFSLLLRLHFAQILKDGLVLALVVSEGNVSSHFNFYLQQVTFEEASHLPQELGNTVIFSSNYPCLSGKPDIIISSGSCLR